MARNRVGYNGEAKGGKFKIAVKFPEILKYFF
jgi:hypothetical protein